MKSPALLFTLLIAAAIAGVGCGGVSGPAPITNPIPPPPTATPAAKLLYVDHNGMFYAYRLPLSAGSKPVLSLTEWPGLGVAPVIAADQYGNVALGSPQQIRIFKAPIVSFAPARASLKLKLTPAITEVGPFGADLVDIEYDPNENLWLLNNLGAQVSEVRAPLTRHSVAAVTIGFGAPGSKTAHFTTLVQARFDVNAALYVYASSSTRSRLFKISFPYAKPPSSMGLDLAQADIIDSTQWPPTAPNAPSLLLGQYFGQLHSPKPGSPPSPPVNVTAQFPQPFNPTVGRFPNAHVDTLIGALIADPYRYSYYALDSGDGSLNVYDLPMQSNEHAKVT
ncbi:MAG: hypothetical protein JO146_06390, partial [Candidatus Eremiobacteraeota bacterium]|nr:hypothetical protein [Candidatus Eremiobacteraeota bacterium]